MTHAFFAFFHLIGITLLLWTLRTMQRSKQAREWPSTKGEVISSKLNEVVSEGDLVYDVKTQVAYMPQEQGFTTDRIAFGYAASNQKQLHDDLLRRLAPGTRVKVFYNPDNPSDATLINSRTAHIRFFLAFAIAWLSLSIGMHLFQVASAAETPSTPLRTAIMLTMIAGFLGSFVFIFRTRNDDRDLAASICRF